MATSTFIPVGDLHPPEWHQERGKGIGGSEDASLFNEGYGCTRRLIMEKRGVPPDYRRTRQQELTLRRGNKLEDLVASEFVEETGLKVRKQPARISKTHPHARVNMDRQIIAVDSRHLFDITRTPDGTSPLADILLNPGPGALECKTMNSDAFRMLQREGLVKHNHYLLQLQHTLAVTRYLWGAFAFLDTTTFDLLWFPMVRQDALCDEILRRVEAAWELVEDPSLPLPAKLPDGDKRCKGCLHRRTCRGDEYLTKYTDADFSTDYQDCAEPEIVELASDFIEAKERADQAAEIVETIKERLQTHMVASNITKLRVPDVRRFCMTQSDGRKTWDGRAIEGEINALRKGELPRVEGLQIEPHVEAIAAILPAIAERFAACQKQGKPSTSFRNYAV